MNYLVQDGTTYILWCLAGYGLLRLVCDLVDWTFDVLRGR